ncbi:glycoside hydrolase family 3 N-terminal domain-containing protein [Planomicrobium sp. Y74]|uniref:beta-glucosidase n=1 Tax=Planomicrobium sp. Y74 TaxID=2478977 RepID=UPI000EF4E2A0|nr:glycoside hydrolase family 3 N-terminal domain-containing protein [Planomicrobium sp. Y74]RLQ92774.1 beta-glucosidase [Planomicrobium sp. Y74]
MERPKYKLLVKQYKAEGKEKVKKFKADKKHRRDLPKEEKAASKQDNKNEIKRWKQDIKSTPDKKERKAKKKGYKKFKKIKRRPYIVGAVAAIVLLISGTFFSWYSSATAPMTEEQESAADYSREIAENVMAESIVLLENENALLPLENDKKINVFGSGAAKPIFGGGGAGAIDSSTVDDLFTAFDQEGIAYNETLFKLYSNSAYEDEASTEEFTKPDKSMLGTLLPNALSFFPSSTDEMPVSELSDEVMEEALNFSDTALYVISRTGSEAIDLTVDKVRLTEDEKATIELLNENFEHIILMANTVNAFELGFIEDYENIESVLWIGAPGKYGTHAIARTLTGENSPSGRLVDTYAYNVESNPAVLNTGDFQYVNENGEPASRYFTNNLEGIYVGYRYYETFLSEEEYEETVQFPFGYGLSYTTFDWEVVSNDFNEEEMSVDVEVTNTGDSKAKEVVQVYFTAPYTEGGIEKSSIELAGYAKTSELEPGQSETVTVNFATRDMSSYDQMEAQAWVLEEGNYQVKVARNIREIEEELAFEVEETIVYDVDETTGVEIANRFDGADGRLEYLSRANPEETFPTEPSGDDFLIPDAVVETAEYEHVPSTQKMPATDADNGIMLEDLKGLDYSDPLWHEFLDQLTAEEMIQLAGDGGYWTTPIKRIGVPATSIYDGPASIRNFFEAWSSVAFPVGVNAASTFNDELIEEMGVAMGQEAVAYDVDAVYAPSMNMHRSPLGGRNFEYYSEDPYISGKMAAAYTRGLQSTGTVAVFKHFAANDQETNRANNGLYVWATEQSLREIYLEPFEITVKEGDPHGAMSAFNRIGTTWAGGSYALLTEILREEWGFEGFVITDAGIGPQGNHFNALQAVEAGNDLMLAGPFNFPMQNKYEKELASYMEQDRAGTTIALRNAAHNIFYYILQTNKVE